MRDGFGPGQTAVRAFVIVHGQRNLLQLALALSAPSCLASLLNGRKQQGNQDGNDGDDDQKFDQRKSSGRHFSWFSRCHQVSRSLLHTVPRIPRNNDK
jgi:hypothetical protein